MGTLSDEIKQVPGVLNVMKIAGYDALSSGSKPNSGALFVGLTTWGERTTKDLSITNIIQEVNKLGKKHPKATIMAIQPPANITRFNGSRNISIQGSNAEGYSSGQAIAAMEEVVHEVVPTGFSIEWSGQSREEKKSAGSTMQVLALALIFVFLCLAALYESWSVPFAVLLTIPTGIFGAFFIQCALFMGLAILGSPNPGLMNSVYMNIGVVMIIGLAAKNAILIVEFAKVRTDKGMDAQEKLTESQTNFFTALYNYNVSKAQLDKAMGVPIYIDVVLYDESVQNGKSAELALKNSILNNEN